MTCAQLAPVFGAGLLGLMSGAFVFGPMADTFGRKTILVVCVLFFGLMSLASAMSTSLFMLVALRFLTGLGLGGAMPNSVTLTSEYCPEHHRLFMATTMFCGFTLGSALGGQVSAQMVGAYCWRSVLVLGGVLPIALLPLILVKLPESARFLVLENKSVEKIAKPLPRMAPEENFDGARYVLNHKKPVGMPVSHLFRRDLIAGTMFLWVTFFASLLIIYLLSSRLPTLVKSTGVSLKTASIVTSMFQVDGAVGAISHGWLMDQFKPNTVLAISYTLATVFIAAIGALARSPVLVGLAVFGAGYCISGSQVGANAFAASFYPTDCRATGVSWANGVGRIGSVLGSMSGGLMLSMNLSLPTVFLIVGLPALVGGASMLLMGRRSARQERLAPATA